MKKLNNKGFTLVELLAVIIILAIVVGISIPAVLTTTNSAKVKAGKTEAAAIASWVDRQYQVIVTGLANDGLATVDTNFTSANGCGANASSCTAATKTITDPAFIAAAGGSNKNITNIQIKINTTTGRSCVRLTIPTTSEYYYSGATLCTTGEQNCYQSATVIKGGIC